MDFSIILNSILEFLKIIFSSKEIYQNTYLDNSTTEDKNNLKISVNNTTVVVLYGYSLSPILDAVTNNPWLINKDI